VASESTPPPPAGGGGAKYAIVGVALFAIALLTWCLTKGGGDDVPPETGGPAVVDAGTVERSTALVEDELEIPELEPDAGPPPDGGQGATQTKRTTGPSRSWDECTGEIATAEARRVFAEHNSQIRNCYERQLKQNPVLEGSMTLAVRVAADGRVDGTQVSGSLRDRDVFACVRNVASHMRFPAPGGRDCALIQVPFTFTPQR